MKFYVAAKTERHNEVRSVIDYFEKLGWINTYDWTRHGNGGYIKEESEEALMMAGNREVQAIAGADVIIVLLEQGRGLHTELGIAAGLSIPVYLCNETDKYFKLDDNTTTFYWTSNVHRLVGQTEELLPIIYNDFLGVNDNKALAKTII
jgi:hypothetical protein